MSERCTDGADDLRDREEAEMLERFYERKRAGESCPTCDGEEILVNVSGDRFKPPTIPCPDCKEE